MSIIKDPESYERFERVIVCHGVRQVRDLAYRGYLDAELPRHPLPSDLLRDRLLYYPPRPAKTASTAYAGIAAGLPT